MNYVHVINSVHVMESLIFSLILVILEGGAAFHICAWGAKNK